MVCKYYYMYVDGGRGDPLVSYERGQGDPLILHERGRNKSLKKCGDMPPFPLPMEAGIRVASYWG